MIDTVSMVNSSAIVPVTDSSHQEKEHFSGDYVHELRKENKSWRLKAQQHEKMMEETKAQMDRLQNETEVKLYQAKQAAQEHIIRAELKAYALAAGMIDSDGLKLADLSSVTLSDDGEVMGAEKVIAKLKENKPYLFKEFKSSSSTAPIPSEKPPQSKMAQEMTDQEYRKAKQQLLQRC